MKLLFKVLKMHGNLTSFKFQGSFISHYLHEINLGRKVYFYTTHGN